MNVQDRTGSRSNDYRPFSGGTEADLAKPPKYRPSLSRLGPDEQALVVQWRGLALQQANLWSARYPHLVEAFQDAATDALHKAALYFDPAPGFSFSTLLYRILEEELGNVSRNNLPRGYRRSTSREGIPSLTAIGPAIDPAETGRTATENLEDVEVIGVILARMEPSLAEILRKRHFERKTLAEIGAERGCTREWVRQIEAKALDQARQIVQSLGLTG